MRVRNSLLFVIALAFLGARAARAQQQDVIIRGGWRFDTAKETMVKNTGIVVRGGMFMEVGANLQGRDLSSAKVIDLKDDQYILPGLFDMHGHYNVDLFGKGRVDEEHYIPMIYLANGVTSTWPAGEFDPEGMQKLRENIDAEKQVGPRIFNSGPYFGTAGPGWNKNATAQQVCDLVDTWANRGAKRFKAKGINAEQLRALIDCAHRHGLTVSGHLGSGLGNTVNPRDGINMGIDGIEHILGGDILDPNVDAYRGYLNLKVGSKEWNDIIALFKQHHVVYSPTMTAVRRSTKDLKVFTYWNDIDERKFFTPYVQQVVSANPPYRNSGLMDSLFDVKMKELKPVYDAGIPLVASTDVQSVGTFIAGFNLHREMQTFVEAGIPAAGAIKAATINAARALNMADKLGSIDPGKFADLIVVQGNPLQDIRNTHNVEVVMKAGRIYDPKAMLKSIEGKIGPIGPEDAPKWMRGRPDVS
jgi:N-acetylglucosamine-6-phosphate deacetylase